MSRGGRRHHVRMVFAYRWIIYLHAYLHACMLPCDDKGLDAEPDYIRNHLRHLLKKYYLWGAANFRLEGVTTGDIIFSLSLFAIGIASALLSSRDLTRHFNGEIELSNTRKATSLLMIMFLVTSAVSICGPIGFISLGVPNISRIICKSTDIRRHYIISSIMGTALLLITFIVVQYVNFGIYLPISATMAIIALPLMILLFVKK